MLTMMQKRDDFAGWLEDLLQVHDSRFTVDTLERKELEQGMDRKTRLAIVPNPVRYAAMHDLGQAIVLPGGLEADLDVCDFVGHRFDINIFWGKDYAGSYVTHSQSSFEAMLYNATDAAKPGVLDTIRRSRQRTVAAYQTYQVGNVGADAFENIRRGTYDFGDLGKPDFAHHLSFTVTLI